MEAGEEDERGLDDLMAGFGNLRLTKKHLQGIGKLAAMEPSEEKPAKSTNLLLEDDVRDPGLAEAVPIDASGDKSE